LQIERKTIYTCPSKYQFRSQQLFPRSKLKPSSSLILLPFACQRKDNKAMFVSRNSLSGNSLSKLSCVCLPLEKLVNGKHFPVKEKFGLVSRKIFFLSTVFVFRETTFQIFLCLFAIRKVGQRKTLSSQRKIWLGFQESVFLENLDGKHFPKIVKNLEMSLFADYIKFDPQTFDCYI